MEWHCAALLKENKARTIPSAGKMIGTIFWNAEGFTVVDFLPRKETVNAV
jgi:hypothetical protein